MAEPIRVLYVDDSSLDRELVRDALEKDAEGFEVVEAASRSELEARIREGVYDLVLSDFNILGYQGLQVIDTVRAADSRLPVIIITGTGSEEVAVEALKRGAADYLLKAPQTFRRLPMTIRAVLDRLREAAELHRLDRELRAISKCSQVLIRAEDEVSLLDAVCRIICGEAGYSLAWVGYTGNDAAKTVRPVAWAGVDGQYVAEAELSWADDTERGLGPAGTAIRTGKPNAVQDFLTDPRMGPWRESALRCRHRSALALPLKDEDERVFGVLIIYSTQPNVITPQEIRLLEELSDDLAFGIRTLRTREERNRVEKQLRSLNEELEERVRTRTAELLSSNQALERMNRMFVGRELRMKELKAKIKKLEARLKKEEAP